MLQLLWSSLWHIYCLISTLYEPTCTAPNATLNKKRTRIRKQLSGLFSSSSLTTTTNSVRGRRWSMIYTDGHCNKGFARNGTVWNVFVSAALYQPYVSKSTAGLHIPLLSCGAVPQLCVLKGVAGNTCFFPPFFLNPSLHLHFNRHNKSCGMFSVLRGGFLPSALTEGEATNLCVRTDYTNISLCRLVRYSPEPVPQLTAENTLHVISPSFLKTTNQFLRNQ